MRPAARLASAALAAATAAGVLTIAAPALARPTGGGYGTRCPSAESLISGDAWWTRKVSPGVSLKTTTRNDNWGQVKLDVMTVNLTTPGISTAPLYRRVANRSPLSSLAAGRTHIVAATDTGYFDFGDGVPLGAVLSAGRLWTGTASPQNVIGFTATHRVAAGALSFTGRVVAGRRSMAIEAINVNHPAQGLTEYNANWGNQAGVPEYPSTYGVEIANGKVATHLTSFGSAPTSRSVTLILGHDSTALNFLRTLKVGESVSVTNTVHSSTSTPLVSAYAAGAQIVRGGATMPGLQCRYRYPMPARTAFGIVNGGKTLEVVIAEDHPFTGEHGLDSIQMARVMRDLGVRNAWELDGSGSTELLAKVNAGGNSTCQATNTSSLTCVTYPADGQERPMPVGLGIYYKPVIRKRR